MTDLISLSAQIVDYQDQRFLIDCGEGTQRQILQAGIDAGLAALGERDVGPAGQLAAPARGGFAVADEPELSVVVRGHGGESIKRTAGRVRDSGG